VFRFSQRGVLSSASRVVGVDLPRVLRPPPRACLRMAGPAPGAQPVALLPMVRELAGVLLFSAVATDSSHDAFRSCLSRKAGQGSPSLGPFEGYPSPVAVGYSTGDLFAETADGQ
jgi:hypothetical protein